MQLFSGRRELVEIRGALVEGPGVALAAVIGLVVNLVVPGCAADADAHVVSIAQIELREQVKPVRNQAAGEITVTVIGVDLRACIRGRPVRVLLFDAPARIVFDGIVPAHRQIGIACIDGDAENCPRNRHACANGGDGLAD